MNDEGRVNDWEHVGQLKVPIDICITYVGIFLSGFLFLFLWFVCRLFAGALAVHLQAMIGKRSVTTAPQQNTQRTDVPSEIGDTLLFITVVNHGVYLELRPGSAEDREAIETVNNSNHDDVNENDAKRPGLQNSDDAWWFGC